MPTVSKPPAVDSKAEEATTDDAILKDAADKTTGNKSPAAAAATTATADAVPVGKVESKGPTAAPAAAQPAAANTATVPSLPQLTQQLSAGMQGMAAGMTPADAMNPVNALQQQLLIQQQRNMVMGGMAGMAGINAAAGANFNLAQAMAAGQHFGTGFGGSQLAQIAAMNQQQQNDKDHNQFQQTMDI